MKRSETVRVSLLAAIAATLLAGCSRGPDEVRRCVDDQGRVLPDSECERTPNNGGYYGGGYYSGGYYSGGYRSYPHWIYGGSFSRGIVSGGHITPSEGAHVMSSSGHTISRGGFGGRGFFGLG